MNSKQLYRLFNNLFKVLLNDGISIGTTLEIPHFGQEILLKVLDESLNNLKKNGTPVIDVDNPIIVVGDIHGNLVDLLRIFTINGLPPFAQYLFLGDYIDKGPHSLECIMLLLAMQNIFPEDIHLLRGNHETRAMVANGLLSQQLKSLYPSDGVSDDILEQFNQIFDYLPFAAVIANKIICLHGGITPSFTSLKSIREIELPVANVNNDIGNLLWNDYVETVPTYRESQRGKGYAFGYKALAQFLENSDLNLMIRGHQHTPDGFMWDSSMKVITVTSTSNTLFSYLSAFVIVSDRVCPKTLPSLDKSLRKETKGASSLPVPANIKQTSGRPMVLSKVPTFAIPKPKYTNTKPKPLGKYSLPHSH